MIYVRPRNLRMLTQLLQLPNIDRVTGFVLPKVTTQTLPVWLNALMQSEHRIMPTIEGEEAFDRSALARLCDQLQPYSERVSAVRIGGNDILALLGIRRSRYRTAYDGPLGNRSEEHTSELQSLMRISYAVFCLKKTNTKNQKTD